MTVKNIVKVKENIEEFISKENLDKLLVFNDEIQKLYDQNSGEIKRCCLLLNEDIVRYAFCVSGIASNLGSILMSIRIFVEEDHLGANFKKVLEKAKVHLIKIIDVITHFDKTILLFFNEPFAMGVFNSFPIKKHLDNIDNWIKEIDKKREK